MIARILDWKNKKNAQTGKKRITRPGLIMTNICLLACFTFVASGIDVSADVGRGAASGAAIGGFLGLIFGGDLGDVVEGAAVGAGAGAIGGAVSGSMKKKEAEKRAQKQREQEHRRIREEQKQQQQETKNQQAAGNQKSQEQALIAAIGEDNYRGLLALIDCEHERAQALAKAGATSSNPDHKLSSIWLKALIANDLKQKSQMAEIYKQIVTADKDIDTEQQASIETDKVLMDVRQERRDRGISCLP